MKLLIIVLLLGSIPVQAQKVQKFKKPVYPGLYLVPDANIIDTTSVTKLNDKFYVGKARQDRMPVLLPFGTGKSIANAGTGLDKKGRMPNLWNQSQQDSMIRRPGLIFYPSSPATASPSRRKERAAGKRTPH
ncbi:hypothetical protein [Niabella aurantiaca]|uniref:hypothetical protein n=1 Tax=Niabella aurantiaca TaxID=379900 RepID=UPI0003749A08|nr:hypothetical protein [Niabella aurantiaca]